MSGNYNPGSIIPADFNTYDPTTFEPATLISGAVVVYRNDSAVEFNAGVTLTPDYDGRAGFNSVNIDTTADARYAAGFNFKIVLAAGTSAGIDHAGAVLDVFNLQNPIVLSAEDITDIADALLDASGNPLTVDNTEVVPSRVVKLGRRADGVSVCYPSIRPRTGEILPWWIDTTDICGGRWLGSVSSPVSGDELSIVVPVNADDEPRVGVNRELAVVWVNPLWGGADYVELTLDITPVVGQTIKALLIAEKPIDNPA